MLLQHLVQHNITIKYGQQTICKNVVIPTFMISNNLSTTSRNTSSFDSIERNNNKIQTALPPLFGHQITTTTKFIPFNMDEITHTTDTYNTDSEEIIDVGKSMTNAISHFTRHQSN